MKGKAILITTCLCACLAWGFAQQPERNPAGEAEAFSKAARLEEPLEKARALERFLKDYPGSASAGRVYTMLFDLYAAAARKSLEYAEKAIAAAPATALPGVLNSLAWSLAEEGIYLDEALAYVRQAIDTARKLESGKRSLAMYLDTMARVQYKLKDYAAAEKTQREAIGSLAEGREAFFENLEYYARLGMIMVKTGADPRQAAQYLAASLLLGAGDEEVEAPFVEVVKVLAPADPRGKRTELFRQAGERYNDWAPDKRKAGSLVAVGYARNGVLMDEALLIARREYEALTPRSPVESLIEATRTLGLVCSHRDEHEPAVSHLHKIASLVPPYDSEVHLRLGKSLEGLGRYEEALSAYLRGAVAFPAPRLMQPLKALYERMHGSDAGLTEDLSKLRAELSDFHPRGPAKTGPANRVVLAELFTGSECGPCLAADQAFDYLLSAYDKNALAVLEYHLHIPAPDPMTNSDSETRAKYYGIRGTPSVLISGTDKVSGGGPRSAAKGRFDLLSFVIDRKLESGTPVSIELEAALNRSTLTVKADAAAPGTSGDLRLRIVLVEELVNYRGSNGWSEHRSVVRRMLGSPAGIPLAAGAASHSETVDLDAVVAGLGDYLEDFAKNPPPRYAGRKEMFRVRKHEMDFSNLSLIAFVQDDTSKEVLQARYLRLH